MGGVEELRLDFEVGIVSQTGICGYQKFILCQAKLLVLGDGP